MIANPSASPAGRLAMMAACALFVAGCSKEPALTTSSAEALRLYRDGAAQYERFYYKEAKASLEKALGYDSLFAMAWARLAAVDMNNQNEPEALVEIGRAMQLLGRVTPREQLVIRMFDRQFHYDNNAAAKIADSLTELFPDQKEAYLTRGQIYQLGNKYEAALQSYEKATQVDTGYALAYMFIGYAYSNLGEQEKALASMQHYIRLAPDAADPRASYADLLMRVGRYDEALEQHQKALALKPDYWYSFMQIGNIDAIKGRLKEAEAQFHQSLKLRPPNRTLESTHLAVAAVLDRFRGKNKEAAELYMSALALDSTNGDAAFGLVRALAKLKRFHEGWVVVDLIRREFARRNLLNTSPMLGYHLMRSNLFEEEGRYDEAIAECDSARDFSDPLTRGPLYQQIAQIYFLKHQYDDALDASEEALRVNPNAPEALLTLVRIYRAMGDREMTAEIGGRLLDLWKNADADYQHLIELRKLLRSDLARVPVAT